MFISFVEKVYVLTMKKICLIFLILFVSSYPQRRMERPVMNPEFIMSDIIYIPDDNSPSAYVTYRIPYNRLVFEKNGDLFEAGYRFIYEVFDNNSKFIERHIKEEKIEVTDFDETNSESLFEQGFIKFDVGEGEYKLISSFTDTRSGREVPLRKGNIRLKSDVKFYQPLIVQRNGLCEEYEFKLTNYEGSIPFDSKEYEIIIPVRNPDKEYYIELSKNGYTFYKQSVIPLEVNGLNPVTCRGDIYLNTDKNSSSSYIVINPGRQILEGEILIKILNKDNHIIHSAAVKIKWYNKPRTLMNRQLAVSLLKYIDEDETYKYIAKADPPDFDSLFFQYWKQYDPSPTTAYNELMNEYYTRADYAAMNFSLITGRTGLDTDRGKIYIKYGKPLAVERKSTEKGKIIEVWLYSNERTFTFIDDKGTGEFNLLKG
jgi:GWxTD domain-containing protein